MTVNEGKVEKGGEEMAPRCLFGKEQDLERRRGRNKERNQSMEESGEEFVREQFKYPSHRLPSSAPASMRATPDKLLDTISERNSRFYTNLNPMDNSSPTHSYHQPSSSSMRHVHQLPIASIPRRPYQLPLSATMSSLYRPHDYYSAMRPATSGDPGSDEVISRSIRSSASLGRITHQSSFPPHSAPSSIRSRARCMRREDSCDHRIIESDHPYERTDHEDSPLRGLRNRGTKDISSTYSDSPSKYQHHYVKLRESSQENPSFSSVGQTVAEVHDPNIHSRDNYGNHGLEEEYDLPEEGSLNPEKRERKKGDNGDSSRTQRKSASQMYPHPLTPSEAAFLIEKQEIEDMRRRLESSSRLASSGYANQYNPGSVHTPEYYNTQYYEPPNVRQSRNFYSSSAPSNKYASDRDVPLLESTSTTPRLRTYSSQGTARGLVQRQASLDKTKSEPVVVHPVITSHRHKFHRRSYAQPMISSSSIRSGSTDQLMQKNASSNPENISSRFYSRKSVTAASFINPSTSNFTADTDTVNTGSSRPPSSLQ